MLLADGIQTNRGTARRLLGSNLKRRVVASGAFASGLGYVMWYAALRGLTATRAAIVQLSVPR
jgi:hypothetical protein